MEPTISIDQRTLDDFNKTIVHYATVCKSKTWPEIINAKALQLAFEVLGMTRKADADAIRKLEGIPWWPKYIAKRIMKGGESFSYRVKSGGDRDKTFTIQVGPQKGTVRVKNRRYYSRFEAKQVSRTIIAARVRSTAFHKAGWLPAVRRLWPLVKQKAGLAPNRGAKRYGVEKGSAIVAVPSDNPFAEISNSAEGITTRGKDALRLALGRVSADMKIYIARKMQEEANRMAKQ